MNSTSDETKKLMQEHISKHGVPMMAYVCSALIEDGCSIDPQDVGGNIWDASIKITKEVADGDDIDSEFFFHNTFVEVLCVDRDDDPLVFDPEILTDDKYLFVKIAKVLTTRLTLLLGIINGQTAEEVYEENPDMFERIRIKKVDADDDDGKTF
jgi:hypothetical protein